MLDMKTAFWLPVMGYEDCYEVSRDGRIRSLDREVRCGSSVGMITGRELKTYPVSKKGYPAVKLSLNGAKTAHLVHRLMLEAFVGPCPPGLEGCHENDISTDNRIENLRWDTHSANMLDVVRNGNDPQASKVRCDHGHDFTPENTILRDGKYRQCRTCKNADSRRRYADGRTDVRMWVRHER